MKQDFDSFDKQFRDAFEGFEVPFDEMDWNKLDEQLEKERHLPPYLYWFKGLEFLVIALGLFTILNLVQHNQIPSARTAALSVSNSEQKAIAVLPSDEIEKVAFPSSKNEIYPAPSEEVQEVSPTDLETQKDNHNLLEAQQKPQKELLNNSFYGKIFRNQEYLKADPSSEIPYRSTKIEKQQKNNIVADRGGVYVPPNPTDLNKDPLENPSSKVAKTILSNPENTLNENTSTLNTSITQTTSSSKATTLAADFNDLETKSITELSVDNQNVEDPLFELKKDNLIIPFHAHKLHFGGKLGVEINNATSYGRGLIAYSGGMIIDMNLSKIFALRTGLNVAQKQFFFEGERIVNNASTQTEGKTHILKEHRNTYQTLLEIPIILQSSVYVDNKWRLYINTGVSGNFIIVKHTTGQQAHFDGQTDGSVGVTMDLNPADFKDGLFAKGKFSENVFLSVTTGIGVERQLSDNLSLFVEPNVQIGVTSMGKSKDRLNSFSLNIGLKSPF